MIAQAQARYPNYNFHAGLMHDLPLYQPYRFALFYRFPPCKRMTMSDLFVAQCDRFSHPGTRMVINTYSALWEPVLTLAQRFGLRRKTAFKHWLTI